MTKFIKDPIHGEIEIPKDYLFIDELINTKEMKRLKNIYQLGECFNVFFGAVHTRFNHSLGVYNNAKNFIEAFSKKIPEQDKKIILAAALLHDIGHGPRSHCFEEWTNHNHELMTNKIILDCNSGIYKVLNNNNIDPNKVVSIINHTHPKKFYYQIVSSQIDADRLDYLLRDSYFTGASYGSIDSGILFKWVDVYNDEIVFDKKATGLIEDLLFSRAQMFKQIYTNKKVLVYQCLLNKMFIRYKQLHQEGFSFVDKYNLYYLLDPYLKNKQWDVDLFLELDDNKLNLIISSWSNENDKILKELSSNYLIKNNFKCSSEPPKTVPKQSLFYQELNYNFTFYNPKEKIMIKTKQGIFEINKLKNETSLLINENKFNYKFYFYK